MPYPASSEKYWDASGLPPDLEGVLAHTRQNNAATHGRTASALPAKELVSLLQRANQASNPSMVKLKVHPKLPVQPERFVLRCDYDPSSCLRCSLASAFTVCQIVAIHTKGPFASPFRDAVRSAIPLRPQPLNPASIAVDL
jgi:hypothetical protein